MGASFIGQRITTHKAQERVIVPKEPKDRARYVFLVDLASYLNRTTQWLHVKAKRMGLEPIMIRRNDSGRAAAAILADDAKKIIEVEVKVADTISPEELMKEQ